jgi:rubrerythrin
MEIFEFAKKMEKDGEHYYRSLAKKAEEKGLMGILNELADAEVKHFNFLVEMEKGENSKAAETEILAKAKNIFSNIQKDKIDPNFSFPQIDIYKKALDIEKQSREFYEQKAKETDQQNHKDLFMKIAAEEKKHYFLIENMIEFMKRPYNWIEFAEWNHLDEY